MEKKVTIFSFPTSVAFRTKNHLQLKKERSRVDLFSSKFSLPEDRINKCVPSNKHFRCLKWSDYPTCTYKGHVR